MLETAGSHKEIHCAAQKASLCLRWLNLAVCMQNTDLTPNSRQEVVKCEKVHPKPKTENTFKEKVVPYRCNQHILNSQSESVTEA